MQKNSSIILQMKATVTNKRFIIDRKKIEESILKGMENLDKKLKQEWKK